jgi:hypothetical protein
MPPVKMTIRPPAGGWRNHDPQTVLQIAQLFKAARLVENADTRIGRALLAAWAAIDPDRPDINAYAQLCAQLEPSEGDYRQAFRNLLGEQA